MNWDLLIIIIIVIASYAVGYWHGHDEGKSHRKHDV